MNNADLLNQFIQTIKTGKAGDEFVGYAVQETGQWEPSRDGFFTQEIGYRDEPGNLYTVYRTRKPSLDGHDYQEDTYALAYAVNRTAPISESTGTPVPLSVLLAQ